MKRIIVLCALAALIAGVPWMAAAQNQQNQENLKKVYDESVEPMGQIDNAVKQAKAEVKFVVCQVGGNWCPWCLRFADFITKDTDVSKLIEENFVYIHVNYNPRAFKDDPAQQKQAEQMLARLGNPGRFGYPVFVVLDGKGKVLHIQDSSFLEEGKGYSKEKVLRFFKNWTPGALSPSASSRP